MHVLIDEQITVANQIDVWKDGTPGDSNDFYSIKQEEFGTDAEQQGTSGDSNLSGNNRLKAKGQAYHYALFVRSIGDCGPSGIAEWPGNDLVVALATDCNPPFDNSREEQAGTFMHELGHNLNLHHGGPIDIRDVTGVLAGSNTGVVIDGASGDNSRKYAINSGMSIQYSSATSGEVFLTNTLDFSGDPGTVTVGTVTISPASRVIVDPADIQKIVSKPAAGTSDFRQIQLKIPFSTTGSTTSLTGALNEIRVDITIGTTSRTLDSVTKPGYSPNIRLDVDSSDYMMNCKANYPSVMSYSTHFHSKYNHRLLSSQSR